MIEAEVQTTIQERLSRVEAERGVRILFACETGSRAWGFASPDSDYDVRFVYAHPTAWYLSVEEARDVIELPMETEGGAVLDMGGWDLRKTLRLTRRSNPVVWEWLQSPYLYRPLADPTGLRASIDAFYSPITACHHYLGICRGTLDRELTGPTVKIKKYFYMLRPLLAALWVYERRGVPPMEFGPLRRLLDTRPEVARAVADLVERKLRTDERVPVDRIPLLDDFILAEHERLREAAAGLGEGTGEIESMNEVFRRMLP